MFDFLKSMFKPKSGEGLSLPEGVRIYAIGDIHGRLDLLDPILQKLVDDMHLRPIDHAITVFLGDYVDRGMASSAVLSRLIEYACTYPSACLKGNHEAYLMRFLQDPNALDAWARLGALPTLTSYGLKPSLKPKTDERAALSAELNAALPEDHKLFLANLLPFYNCGDFFFVHAGVRPGVALSEQREEDMLYIRDAFLQHTGDFGKFVVHGHTPVKAPDRRSNRINIDTGAYATGNLTCLCIDQDGMRFM